MTEKKSILIVEDNESERMLLSEFIQIGGLSADTADNGKAALKKISENDYNLIITDLIMTGGIDGEDVLNAAKKKENAPEVIITTGYGSIENAVKALKSGAFDYISKPLDFKRILITVRRALEQGKLKKQVVDLQSQIENKSNSDDFITIGFAMKEVLKKADKVSKTTVSVLIDGESGTGKELVAQYIHRQSKRAEKPFITVNCASLPETLLESELFGHVKGAFTGAINNKKGLFEEADKGTILLDEIGEIPLQLQAKLLRVLQDGEVRRVGSNKSIHVNTRVIASTNKNLEQMVSDNTFREDLYYRLKVIQITLPSLRDRKDEIIPLSNHFLTCLIKKMNKKVLGLTEEAQKILTEYNWPGNVRELKNCIEATFVLTNTDYIEPSDLYPVLRHVNRIKNKTFSPLTKFFVNENMKLKELYDSVEKEYIFNAMKKNQSNLNDLAKDMGISRSTLWRKMNKYRINTHF